MTDYVFGANILENLTTGMYQDSKVIYREYIQNACDQIDKAINEGLLTQDNAEIQIWLDNEKRTISIEDNATGIRASEFQKTLGNIADSDKELGRDKGFRGIGRLCGLAYCRELVFSTTFFGEKKVSIMRCDAQKMRELITQNALGEKRTANDVLSSIYSFSEAKTNETEHWFKVELIGINNENTDLLDFSQIKNYLSFIAPVPYQNTFIFRSEIYKKAEELNYVIDQYKIKLNGEEIFKKYKTNFKTSKGEDEIFNLEFKEIRRDNGELLAWLWYGVSRFKGVISKDCLMRGLRLRKENIQIGNDDALQKLFTEDRGHHYFIGEVFAVSKNLIPNSQRDYFNENPTRVSFEKVMRRCFNDELKKIYYSGSAINSAFQKIDIYEKKESDYRDMQKRGDFVDDDHRSRVTGEIEKARIAAEKAVEEIEKKKQKNDRDPVGNVVSRVIQKIESERNVHIQPTMIPTSITKEPAQAKPPRRVDKLSSYNKNERKLISKIFGIIVNNLEDKTAEMIIKKIEEELQ